LLGFKPHHTATDTQNARQDTWMRLSVLTASLET
jgi:hypothetical protein